MKRVIFSALLTGAFLAIGIVTYSNSDVTIIKNLTSQHVEGERVSLQSDWKTPKESLEALVADSPLIVEGIIKASKSYVLGDSIDKVGLVYTDHVVEIEKVIKGDPVLDTVTVMQFGGYKDNILFESDDDLLFTKNERFLLFLKPYIANSNGDVVPGKYNRVIGPQGSFKVVEGKLINNYELNPVRHELNGMTLDNSISKINTLQRIEQK